MYSDVFALYFCDGRNTQIFIAVNKSPILSEIEAIKRRSLAHPSSTKGKPEIRINAASQLEVK